MKGMNVYTQGLKIWYASQSLFLMCTNIELSLNKVLHYIDKSGNYNFYCLCINFWCNNKSFSMAVFISYSTEIKHSQMFDIVTECKTQNSFSFVAVLPQLLNNPLFVSNHKLQDEYGFDNVINLTCWIFGRGPYVERNQLAINIS